jgi:RNA polymerase sigma-70 factor (ECF subfamily)
VTDDELMARGARGNEEAFRLLVQRWERPVFAFLERMLGSREEAQDLGQETFLRMCRQAPGYRATGQFKSWLFRIAGNLARSKLRRRKLISWVRFDPAIHDRPTALDTPDRAMERDETREEVRHALAQLPDRQRQAILLRQYQEMSYREIADAMRVSIPAVESLLNRGMKNLGKELKGER